MATAGRILFLYNEKKSGKAEGQIKIKPCLLLAFQQDDVHKRNL